ncbi:ATP-binding protein [Streptomyces sp. NPDC021356]|uniref:ATP-binding protein n=1 Tax=Streptomyces sp. NPDC021356 TaxID=3154900 RepID=UPI0033CE2D77
MTTVTDGQSESRDGTSVGAGGARRADRAPEPGGEPARLCSTVPADPSWAAAVRRLVRRHLARLRLSADQCDSAVLATDELFANAVRHASTGPRDTVTLTIERTARTLRVTVADRSPLPPRRRTADAAAESGRGLAIVAALADDWGLAPPEPGTSGKGVWFTLSLRGAAS